MTTTTTKIGLEIHCQLTGAKSKLFCRCSSDYRGKTPNTNICPICAGLPGTLPLLNQKTVEFAAMITLALGCKFPDEIAFYRKNYFYPDLPKNFQLTQYNAYGITSIGVDGKLKYENGKDARIRRVQLEEDPGRLVYASGSMDTSVYVLIDYNRAGVPLVEIVTEPDFADPKDVRIFLDKITSIIEHLGVCDTKLEGSVRCDANVSIEGKKKVEIKNVNSFKEVEKALTYEITRQKTMSIHDIEIKAETRHWDDKRKITKQARSKEEEEDYRYFPEPDIPKILLENLSLIKTPELPDERKFRFINDYGLSEHVSQVLIDNKDLADLFESAIKIYHSPKSISNWIVSDILAFMEYDSSGKKTITDEMKIDAKHIAEIAKLVDENTINRSTAKSIISRIIKTGELPSDIIKKEKQMTTIINDEKILLESIDMIFKEEKKATLDAKQNPTAINFLLGKIMRLTKGRADPKITTILLKKRLDEEF